MNLEARVRPEIDVSIHDVMPRTLRHVEELLATGWWHARPRLLVVPGCSWSDSQVERLRRLAAEGCELAGHGWVHSARRGGGPYVALHRALLSRGVAEHLPLSADEIAELVERCYSWFVEQHLPAPRTYVPPAWALGRIPRERLRRLPFERFETLGGVLWPRELRFEWQALQGFEADTRFREASLRLLYRWSWPVARRLGVLRVAIHPFDAQLRTRDLLERSLRVLSPRGLGQGTIEKRYSVRWR